MKEKDIRKLMNKGASASAGSEEKGKMLDLFHQDGLEYELKEQMMHDLQDIDVSDTSIPGYEELSSKTWTAIQDNKSAGNTKYRVLTTVLRIAAVLLIGLMLGAILRPVLSTKHPQYYAAHSPKGSTSELQLPDGTSIILNAGSEVTYTLEGKKGTREVILNGEAWFDVAENKRKPFVVHTSAYDVQVTGTEFNVKSSVGGNVLTTLVSGSVTIETKNSGKKVKLQPGQQAAMKGGKLKISAVNTSIYTAWKDGKLIFNEEYLPQVVERLEAWYDISIELDDDERLAEIWYTGTIEMETLEEVLELLKVTAPIKYTLDPKTKEIKIEHEPN